jgi:hypothetical protein
MPGLDGKKKCSSPYCWFKIFSISLWY